MNLDIRVITLTQLQELVAKYHAYGAIGSAVKCFGVFEDETLVAGFSWLPPPPGAAVSVCPECPYAVLSLSRMVAVPKAERKMKHISKALKVQMKRLIDRGRWPVLVTYSDETVGHNGFVYQCSGWQKTIKSRKVALIDADGKRQSGYSNGSTVRAKTLHKSTVGFIQRWEHWICERGTVREFMETHGWVREPKLGVFYKSGNPAYHIVRSQS